MVIANINQAGVVGGNNPKDGLYSQDQRLLHRLEVQSGQIEKIFAHNQLPTEVTHGTFRRGAFTYEMKVQLQGGLERLRIIKNDLINALGVSDIRLIREDGRFKLNVGRSHPHAVDLIDLHLIAPKAEGVSVILGLDEEGKLIILNLADKEMGNILISGMSTAGKSGLLRTIAVSLALANRQSQVQMGILTAPSGYGGFIGRPNLIQPLNYLPHLLFPVVSSTEEIIEALQFLADELTYREETGLDWPLLVVLVDNADLLLERGDYAIISLLTRLATSSTAAGLRLILCATNPHAGELGRILKHNVSLKLTGRTARSQDQRRVEETTQLNGEGDFLADSYGVKIRFQAAFIDDYDLHLTLEALHNRNRILLAQTPGRMSVLGEEEQIDDERSFVINRSNGEILLDREHVEDIEIFDSEEDKWMPDESLGARAEPGQVELFATAEEELVDAKPENGNIVHLNSMATLGHTSVTKVRKIETEYSDFEDDWRWKNEDDGNESFRHYH